MSIRIYESSVPPVPLVNKSIFTHLLCSEPGSDPSFVGSFPGSYTAFVDATTGTSVTRAQLKSLALSFAHGLRQHPQTAAKRGDTILIFSPNSFAWPVALLGSIAAGLRCTFANSAYTPNELAFQYIDSRARLICTTAEGVTTVREMFRQSKVSKEEGDKRIIILSDSLAWAGGPSAPQKPETKGLVTIEDLLNFGSLKEEEKFTGEQAYETTLLCYSSGTTGQPKGVETTHVNLTSICDMVDTVFPDTVPETDAVLGILPFYHVYGAVKLMLYPLFRGLPCVIQSRFEPVQFCANIAKYKISVSLIVPPVMVLLARHPVVDQYDMSSLRWLISGAAPLGASLIQQVHDRFAAKRNPILIGQGYGLTETSPTTHLLPVEDSLRKAGSIGILLPNLQARLVIEDDHGNEIDAPVGERGELWIKGPTVMKGYLNNPSATEKSITKDGWFKTGDIGLIDSEGYYFIVDRQKELIKYKGFQVPPAELESVLLTHPLIADVAVIGVYNAHEATEVPRAYVVHAKPEQVKTDQEKRAFGAGVVKWLETKVAKHKFLRGGATVIDIIPKSAAGKILRRELRERAQQDTTLKAKL